MTETTMTREEYDQIEREIQLGTRDTLPDGRKITDVQESLANLQKEQETQRAEAFAADGGGEMVDGAKSPENADVAVTVHENGVMTARPVVERETVITDGNKTPDSDLPIDFPMREQLIAAGFGSLETVAKFDKESLVGISGIGEKSAEKILAYGKSE